MSSSNPADSSTETADWREAQLRYNSLGRVFRRTFGHRVWKVSVDGRFTCPNVDGTVGTGGCVFCNLRSFSPSRRAAADSITDQINQGAERLRQRHGVNHFIAYFQSATNTYAPIQRLRELWDEALSHPDVVGLIIGTRPDCVADDVLDLLSEFSRRTWLSVEYGLQTIHNRSLDWLNRGHHYAAFLDAVGRSRQRDIRIGAHLILGLPGETQNDMLATAREMTRLRIESVKLHNLHVVKDTPLAQSHASGQIKLPTLDEYVGQVVDFLEHLWPNCAVDRLSGDAPAEYLIAPEWCRDKSAVRKAVEAEFQRRDSWQGLVRNVV